MTLDELICPYIIEYQDSIAAHVGGDEVVALHSKLNYTCQIIKKTTCERFNKILVSHERIGCQADKINIP